MKLTTSFYPVEAIADAWLTYAVIVSRWQGQWIFCRQKTRDTFELPAGRREPGEAIDQTASRELQEETGARRFSIEPICAIHVAEAGIQPGPASPCGKLYFAEILELGTLATTVEIAEIILCLSLPESLSYPAVQPILFDIGRRYAEGTLDLSSLFTNQADRSRTDLSADQTDRGRTASDG